MGFEGLGFGVRGCVRLKVQSLGINMGNVKNEATILCRGQDVRVMTCMDIGKCGESNGKQNGSSNGNLAYPLEVLHDIGVRLEHQKLFEGNYRPCRMFGIVRSQP